MNIFSSIKIIKPTKEIEFMPKNKAKDEIGIVEEVRLEMTKYGYSIFYYVVQKVDSTICHVDAETFREI